MSDDKKMTLDEALAELKRTIDELEKSLDVLEESMYKIVNTKLSPKQKAQLKLVKSDDR